MGEAKDVSRPFLSTRFQLFLSSERVVGYIVGIPFVRGLHFAFRIANLNHVKRNHVVGQCYGAAYSLHDVCHGKTAIQMPPGRGHARQGVYFLRQANHHRESIPCPSAWSSWYPGKLQWTVGSDTD